MEGVLYSPSRKTEQNFRTSMKNILIFCHRAFPLSATFIYRQVQIAGTQHRIHLVTLDALNDKYFPLPGVNRWIVRPYYGLLDRLLFYWQKRRSTRPLKFSNFAVTKIMQFAQRNEIEVLHIHYGTWAVHLLPVLKKLKIPFIVSFHGYDASSALQNDNYKLQLPELFDLAERLVIVSDHMRLTLNLSSWSDKIHLIPYGIDENIFSRTNAIRAAGEIKILHSGRLTPKKGVPDLIRVFFQLQQEYTDISLHVLGDGEEMEDCLALVNKFQLTSSVIFYGSKPISQVIELMDRCDIFVLNSRVADNGDMEGLPNSILEAMCMEMAVVSTNHAGIPMAIKDMQSGLLVPERDNNALLLALKTLIDDPSLRLKLGVEARRIVSKEFTIQRMGSNLLLLYENLMRHQ